MKQRHLFLASPHMSEEGYEQEFVKQAFDSNWIAPLGENVTKFEQEMASKLGAKDAAALSSGTAAIHLALKLAGVGPGDVVFCQSLTFSATANPIVYQQATPVFIDSDEDTWNMSPAALKRAFELYPNPKAVIAVHLYGMAANLVEIGKICAAHGVPLIEDAAESLGTTYHGRYTGSIGDYGIISFNGNKIITSSGGGMLLVNTPDATQKAEKARFWATQSRERARHYQHNEIGYNYRMSNVVAGIGRGQLRVLDRRVEQKRHIYEFYRQAFAGIDDLTLMPMREGEHCNCWLSAVQVHGGKVTPAMLMDALELEDIESRPVWKPMHLQPVFAGCPYVDNGGVAQKLFENGVCLPSDTKMDDEDLERVARVVKHLWEES